MRRNHGILLVLLLLLAVVSQSSSRLLKPIDSAMEETGIITRAASSSEDPATDFSNLMGADVEECADQSQEDEECVKRRMIAEAHLDYIYTQHHKP